MSSTVAVCGMFTRYLRSCADNQVELLAGRLSPLQLLLLDEAGQVADVLYASNPVSHLLNRVAAAVVRTYAEHLAAASPPARILEIGAGTGATSAQILPGLPPDAVRYRFTDVSTSFTQRAERQFAAHTFVEYGLYDMNREPLSQASIIKMAR